MYEMIYGFIFGVLSGCGIGGGSILVPLLVLFGGVAQKTAQGVCLVAYLPTAVTALVIHCRNKNVKIKTGVSYAVFGIVFAVGGSVLTAVLPAPLLRKAFGVFLIGFAVYQAIEIGGEKRRRSERK